LLRSADRTEDIAKVFQNLKINVERYIFEYLDFQKKFMFVATLK